MSQNYTYPSIVLNTVGIPTYANFASLPAIAADGAAAITLDNDELYVFNLATTTWVPVGGASVPLGIGTIDSQTAAANGAVIASNQLFMQSASTTRPGLVNNAAQSFSGNKTFTGSISASNLSGTNTGDVSLGTANGLSLVGQALSLGLSSSSTTGALSSADWTTFNSKQAALTPGSISTSTTGVSVGSGANSTVGPNVTVNVQTASGSQPGLLSAADWTTFNSKQATISTSSAPANQFANGFTSPNTFTYAQPSFSNLSGSASVAQNGIGPVSKTLYVDGTRVDSYTADGSFGRPFKTIMAAVNKVIANGDNSSFAYVINVAAANYGENITLNSLSLYNISIVGPVKAESFVAGIVGTITSTSNNANLGTLVVQNLTIGGDVTLVGDTNNTTFGQTSLLFYNCNFQFTTGLTFTNLGNITLIDNAFYSGGTHTFTNVNLLHVSGGDGHNGDVSIVTNFAGNQPSGFGGSIALYEAVQSNTTSLSIDTDSYMQYRIGCRLGAPGTTISISGTLETYDTTIRANILVNASGTWVNHAPTAYTGTLTNNGTVSINGRIGYAPTTSSDWSSPPNNIPLALDDLASSGIYKSQSANLFLASPNGSSGVPSFRAIVPSDVPTLNQNTTGTSSNVTGVVALVHGGTGTAAASANAAFNALSPMTTSGDIIYGGASGAGTRLGIGSANQVLSVSGGIPAWTTISLSGVAAIGTIDSQSKSADGLVISGSFLYAQTADASFPGLVSTGTQTFAGAKTFTGAISASNLSGTNTGDQTFASLSPLTTKGDILGYSTVNARVPVGTNGQVLTADSAQTLGVKWATPTTGTVTSVALTVPSFLSVAGSPVTSSGTLAVTLSGTALPVVNGGTGIITTTAYGVLTGGTTATGNFQNAGTGSSGQVLTSNGSSALPTWNSLLRTINAQSGTTYTFVLSDGSGAGGDPLTTFGSASATTVTVPTNASVAFPVGTQIDCLQQGAGKVTFVGAGGVTVNAASGNLSIASQYTAVSLIKTATDTWTLIGNLIA